MANVGSHATDVNATNRRGTKSHSGQITGNANKPNADTPTHICILNICFGVGLSSINRFGAGVSSPMTPCK
jgi:hypothetical protein